MGKPKIKPHTQQSVIQQALKRRESATVTGLPADNFLLSFQHLDREQGQSLGEWEAAGMLASGMTTLWNLCSQPLRAQLDGSKFTEYGDFPPANKTEFRHPRQVPPDASWARVHVDGLHCIIGHIVRNVFYVVFLDAKHRFWISEKRNT